MLKKLILICFLSGMLVTAYSQGETSERCIPEDFVPSAPEGISDIVGDFTITDSQGVTWNLYDQLNQGKTVIIDLYFTT